jgi:CubicO group peptidase (beta-lactamase class C family)
MTIEAELGSVLREAAAEHHVPGAVAGVIVGDESYTATHGVMNAEFPAPVTAASMSQVASITKTFASAAMMLLVQDGRVRLEDPVAHHLPMLGSVTGLDFDTITIEQILSHQSGFDGDHLFVERVTHDLARLKDARRLFPPGEDYSYNNAGFSVAGAVIEAVSGQSFASFTREHLLLPLGMTAAGFTADHAITYPVLIPHVVIQGRAYVIRGAGWQPGWELGPVDHAAGGLIASVEHLLAWCRFQRTGTAADGTVILTPESLDRLHTPVVTASRVEAVALDWSVENLDGVPGIGHGGVTAGYMSDLLVVAERDFAFVGLTNATNGSVVNQTVRRWALERFAGIHETDPEPDPSLTIDVDRLTGRYRYPFAALSIAPGEAPNTVVVTSSVREDTEGWKPPPDPPVTLGFFAPDHAVTLDANGPAEVARFDPSDGRADWVLWSGRRSPRVD